MKAWIIEQFGGADVMKIADVAKPEIGPEEVLVEISHTAINPVDWKIREGYLTDLLPHEFPIILGWDVAGTIAAVGERVKAWKPGQKVFAYARKPFVQAGTYAEFVALDQSAVAQAPKSAQLREAAGVPLTALTAYQALFDFAGLKAGETVYIANGAGGVGSFAVGLAKHRGAKVIATGSKRNHDYLRELGVDHALDYADPDLSGAVRRIAPAGVDVVFDCIGGEGLESGWRVLKSGGRLVSIVDTPSSERARELGVTAGFVFVQPSGAQLGEIADLIDQGKVRMPAITERSIREAPDALEQSKRHAQKGKVVLKIDF